MPGDHTYATPEIPMVIIWNGLNHYCPTYPSNWDDIINWKLTLVDKHISEAISIFGEVEGELDDAHDFPLCEQFHSLRDTAVNAQKMLTSASVHINKVVIPEPHIGPDPRDIMTSLTRTTNLAKHPVPAVKGFMSERLESIVDVAEATNPAVPLVPIFTSAPTQQTQIHSRPIPTPREIPPVVPVSKPGPTPVTRPGPTPVSKPGPTPVTRPGPTPVSKPGPTPVRKPGTTPVGKPGGSGGARPKGSTPFIFLTPKGPAPKPKPRQHTVPSIVCYNSSPYRHDSSSASTGSGSIKPCDFLLSTFDLFCPCLFFGTAPCSGTGIICCEFCCWEGEICKRERKR